MSEGIQVSWPAIRRAWRPGAGFWLQLSGARPRADAYAAMSGAMSRANERRAGDTDVDVGGSGVSLTGRGPVLFVGFSDSAEALQGFVADVVTDLEGQGVSGELGVARSDETAFDDDLVTCLAAAATVPLDVADVVRDAGVSPALIYWYGRPEATAAVVDEAVAWTAGAGPDSDTLWVRTEGFQRRCSPDQAREQLRFSLSEGTYASSVLALGPAPTGRRVTFSPVGYVGAVVRSADDRRTDFDVLKDLLVRLAPHLEQGLIRQAGSVPGFWDTIVCGLPPDAQYGDGRANSYRLGLGRHLFDRYVVDPYAGQLLTDAHLDAVRGWDGWSVEPVAPGRWWAQPSDVEAWIEGETAPEPAVLAARDLFRPILLTPEAVERAPRPW